MVCSNLHREIDKYTVLNGEISIVDNSVCDGTSINLNGCLILKPLSCKDGNVFSDIKGSMPNSLIVSGSDRLGPSDCEIMCKSNCLCTAFSSFLEDGIGC